MRLNQLQPRHKPEIFSRFPYIPRKHAVRRTSEKMKPGETSVHERYNTFVCAASVNLSKPPPIPRILAIFPGNSSPAPWQIGSGWVDAKIKANVPTCSALQAATERLVMNRKTGGSWKLPGRNSLRKRPS